MAFKVLMVSDAYPPLIGGAERDTQMLCRELTNRGHSVTVATAWHPGLPEQAEDSDAGVWVHRIKGVVSRVSCFSSDPKRRHPPPFPDPEAVWRFRRLIARLRPDLVHSYGWIDYTCAAALHGQDIPLVLSLRDYTQICPTGTMLRNLPGGTEICTKASFAKCLDCATRYYGGRAKAAVSVAGVLGCRGLLSRHIAGLHCCSTYIEESVAEELLASLPARKRRRVPVRAIQGFRDDAADEPASLEILRRLPATPFILFVGALRLIKGIEPLLEAYRRISPAPPLVLMGTPQPDTPRDFPPGTLVVHDVPHGTVMAAWERALFGVAPSILPEPLGNVVHEAMSKGKAVIGTIPGGMRDMIVDGETGMLVPIGDVGALAAAMQRLIADEPFRQRLARAALERAKCFTAQAMVPRFESLYDEVMQISRGKSSSDVEPWRPSFSVR